MMPSKNLLLKPIFLGLFMLLPVVAAATEEDLDSRVRELFGKANALFQQKKPAEAEAVYEEAWALRQTHDVAANLAVAELSQGKTLEALSHLRFALDHSPAGDPKKRRKQVEADYAEALSGVAILTLRVNPDDATVTVDGPPTVSIPEGLAVQPGKRVVIARKTGFVSATTELELSAGERREVTLSLVQQASSVAPTPSSQGAPRTAPPQGKGEEPSIVPVAIAAGASVVLLAGGVGLTLAADSAEADVVAESERLLSSKTSCAGNAPACADLRDAADRHDTLSTVSEALFVGAGVAAGVAVALWFWPSDADSPKENEGSNVRLGLELGPLVSTDRVSVTWSGRF